MADELGIASVLAGFTKGLAQGIQFNREMAFKEESLALRKRAFEADRAERDVISPAKAVEMAQFGTFEAPDTEGTIPVRVRTPEGIQTFGFKNIKSKQEQLAEAKAQQALSEVGKPFEQTREAEKLRFQQELELERTEAVEDIKSKLAQTEKKSDKAKVLRDELRKDTKEVGTQEVNAAFNRIQASAKDPSPAGDFALIFNYMKMLDPGSVVRESEFKAAGAAGALPDKALQAAYDKWAKGTLLAKAQRKDFVDRASRLRNAAFKTQANIDEKILNLAKEERVNPAMIFGGPERVSKVQSQIKKFKAQTPDAGGGEPPLVAPVIPFAPTDIPPDVSPEDMISILGRQGLLKE